MERLFRRCCTNKGLLSCWMIAALVIFTSVALAGGSGADSLRVSMRAFHHEVPDDPFVPVDRSTMPTSPAYRITTPTFTSVQVNVDSLGRNIVGDAANEPTIAVDPTNPNRMAIGWRQFNTVTNNFRQAGYAYTTDAGLTWTFPGVIQPGIFRSDPVFDYDADGNFYYNSLTTSGPDYLCDVFPSSTGGASWGLGTSAHGGDKQWMIIDKTRGLGDGNIYSFWTSSFSSCLPGFFTRSVNRNASYQSCVAIPGDPFWGTLAVGPSGELYICGTSNLGIMIAKSSTAQDSNHTVTWDTTVAVNLDGDEVAFAGSSSPNPGGLHGQAWVAVDRSNGPYRGYVYVLCSVQRNSNPDPLDVMFARSTNGGRTWSSPVRVNDDISTTAWQWFGTMSVAPTGRIDAVWLDTRDNPGSVNSSLYYSYSTDAGVTWATNLRLSQAFDPHAGWPNQNKMGDYYHMVSDSSGAHLAWAATFGGEQNVYYGHIAFPLTGVKDVGSQTPSRFSLSQNYPNPFNPGTEIQFSLPQDAFVNLSVFNLLGEKVATIVSDHLNAGTHTVRWDAAGLPSGIYFYRLEAGNFVQTKRLVVLR